MRNSSSIAKALALTVLLSALLPACSRGGMSGVQPSGASADADPALAAKLGADEAASIAALPSGVGHDLVLTNCIVCHSAAMILQQRKDSAGWERTMTQMVTWGAPVSAEQRPVLVAYLNKHFGTTVAKP